MTEFAMFRATLICTCCGQDMAELFGTVERPEGEEITPAVIERAKLLALLRASRKEPYCAPCLEHRAKRVAEQAPGHTFSTN